MLVIGVLYGYCLALLEVYCSGIIKYFSIAKIKWVYTYDVNAVFQ